MKALKVLTYFISLIFLISCSHRIAKSDGSSLNGSRDRSPSSLDMAESCGDLILPIIDEYRTLSRERWELEELVRRELVDEEQWHEFRQSEDWQRFIARENQSDEEKEMGFTVLSLLKKRFPRVDNGRLKDRYRVLMAFCGD